MAKLPSPWMGLASGIYQGYMNAENRQYEREDREAMRADRQASLDLQRQQESRIGDYQKWQMGQAESAQKERLQQQYMKAVSADLTGMDESRKQVFHTYVNSLEQQLGIQPTPYRPGMYDKKQSIGEQADAVRPFIPEGYALPEEAYGKIAPDLLGQTPQGPPMPPAQLAVPLRQPAPIGGTGSIPMGGAWKDVAGTMPPPMPAPQPQPATPSGDRFGPFVRVQQQLDPKTAANTMRSDYISLKEAVERNANPAEIQSIVQMIALKHKTLTGKELTEDELKFNMDNMRAYEAGRLEISQQNADTAQQRANDTKTYQTGMLGVAKQNANTAEKRATAYVNNFQADKTKATGTALLSYYNSLKSRKAAMLKGGLYSPTSQVIQEIDAEIAEMEPIIREAKGLAGSGGGKTWSTSKYDAELSPDLKAAAQSGIAAGKVGPALRAELKARGLPDALVQSEYVRLMKQFYDPYKRK